METISGRLRLRGLLNANILGLQIAAAQNLKHFLAATGWGRRRALCGSLLALPEGLGTSQPSTEEYRSGPNIGTDNLDLAWLWTATSAT